MDSRAYKRGPRFDDGGLAVGAGRAVIVWVLALLAVASVGVTVLVAYPFSPLGVYGVNVIPDEVCPGEQVRVETDSEIEAGWRIRRIEIVSIWEPVPPSDRAAQSGGAGIVPEPEPRERGIMLSEVVRVAPTLAGDYRLKSEAEVYGTFGSGPFRGFPKTQGLEYDSSGVTTVLSATDGRCAGKEPVSLPVLVPGGGE